jgi:transposase InsO family protein
LPALRRKEKPRLDRAARARSGKSPAGQGGLDRFYLSTVLDDFSRYIVAWKLCTNIRAVDATATLDLTLQASGLHEARLVQRLRLLSDNGSSYVASDLAKWLDAHNIKHIRGASYTDSPKPTSDCNRRI